MNMKINEQLFEDVLSDKLKGTFILRNGDVFTSDKLHRNYENEVYPYIVSNWTYTSKGTFWPNRISSFDIIDFKPDTDEIDPELYSYNEKDIHFIEHFINSYHMKENELIIEIPDNKVVDWDESKKQNKIVLKDKQLTYRNICEELFKDGSFYINSFGKVLSQNIFHGNDTGFNSATSLKQLECILAKNALANVASFLNNSWKPSIGDDVWYIAQDICDIHIFSAQFGECCNSSRILFKEEKFAKQAIDILGKETVKLALKPLGVCC